MEKIIEIKNMSKRFGPTIALNNVDITSNISNDYIIDNVIFCDVSGQLKIRIDNN